MKFMSFELFQPCKKYIPAKIESMFFELFLKSARNKIHTAWAILTVRKVKFMRFELEKKINPCLWAFFEIVKNQFRCNFAKITFVFQLLFRFQRMKSFWACWFVNDWMHVFLSCKKISVRKNVKSVQWECNGKDYWLLQLDN